MSQPAASRQIQALEAELGVLLFDRIGRRLQLTSEGEDIVRRGRRLLQEADLLRDRADALKGGLTGTLRVGASPQNIETVLAPFVARFRSKHPGIEVHFVEDGGARISDRLCARRGADRAYHSRQRAVLQSLALSVLRLGRSRAIASASAA